MNRGVHCDVFNKVSFKSMRLYAELTLPVSTWFDIKAGSRYGRTETNSFYFKASSRKIRAIIPWFPPSIYPGSWLVNKA
ncbi:MAG: hypothetical protein INR73_00635 [Williamsia sp.]|nr:hypothetical protein [Williamsia sp.]